MPAYNLKMCEYFVRITLPFDPRNKNVQTERETEEENFMLLYTGSYSAICTAWYFT